MPSLDMPLEQLRQYKPPLHRESDFDAFWASTLNSALNQPLNAEWIPLNLPTPAVQCYALRYDGFADGGAAPGRIAGWYVRPKSNGKFPGLCVYHGYSGRAPRPLDLLVYASLGFCVLSMDCRGQLGESQDAAAYPAGSHLGWMTRGITSPRHYYFRNVYADAVRALELLGRREEVDAARLAVTGVSQGGGLTLAVAALSQRPKLALPDIPFLCDFRRALAIAPIGPYPELAGYLRAHPHQQEQVLKTLSYCDNLNLAPRIRCRTVVSNCLWDDLCPPSTIFGVYNHIVAEKSIEIYPYHGHEVPYEHLETKYRLLAEMLA